MEDVEVVELTAMETPSTRSTTCSDGTADADDPQQADDGAQHTSPAGTGVTPPRQAPDATSGATTGFNQVLKIILSGLCKKIDIYGMSANCGGYYHKRQVNMKVQHSCELESWALHHIMRNYYDTLHTCVYI